MIQATPTDELAAALALIRAPGVGPATFRRLLDCFGSCQACLGAGQSAWRDAGAPQAVIQYLKTPDWGSVEADLRWAQASDCHILLLGRPAYPEHLAQIADPPPLLFVRGDLDVLSVPALAIVGSRNPTSAGRRSAHEFSAHLVGYGLTVVSGLAVGIDAAAHEGALSVGGLSVAVCGNGLDTVYPARHRDLAHRLLDDGALVSELPPGTPPAARNFPRRNRIISGLSIGTLVVEAALKSGSLISARLAMEQGREVFAIPGSIHNPLARGCHALIRDGAKLVETARDILEELAPLLSPDALQRVGSIVPEAETASPEDGLDEEYRQLLACLDFSPTGLDELVARSGLTADKLSSMLLILELEGLVESAPGGRYSRVR
ncbi:MAG: DNA-processing protein DprA [Pseudomonadota bacterium]|nr:DNA-processing protein DprA [Pseudomonadota bacterium]